MSDFGRFWLTYLGAIAAAVIVWVASTEVIEMTDKGSGSGFEAASAL